MSLKEQLEAAGPPPPLAKAVIWNDGEWWLGYWQEWPDYWTQGETPDELEAMLASLWQDMASGELPGLRRVVELQVPAASAREIAA